MEDLSVDGRTVKLDLKDGKLDDVDRINLAQDGASGVFM
jgi:hypothetical protein